MRTPFRRRTQPATADMIHMQVQDGDVADILPAELGTTRSLEDDRRLITEIAEQLAATGSIDRATGGHLLDELVTAWHDAQISDIRRSYLGRWFASRRLVGQAEASHALALEQLGAAAQRWRRHAAATAEARRQMIGDLPTPEVPHHDRLARAEQRLASHHPACPAGQPPTWVAPWHEPTPDNHLTETDQ